MYLGILYRSPDRQELHVHVHVHAYTYSYQTIIFPSCIQYHCASFLHFAGCVNVFGNPDACKAYAEQGECDVNTSWMSAFCRESCFSCKYTGMCHCYHTIYFPYVAIFHHPAEGLSHVTKTFTSLRQKGCFIASIVIFKALPDLRRQFKPV